MANPIINLWNTLKGFAGAAELTDEEWKVLIRQEGLDRRTHKDLEEMFESHAIKFCVVEPESLLLAKYPDVIRHQLEEERARQIEEMGESELTDAVIEEEVKAQLAYYTWKVERLKEVCERIIKEQELRAAKVV